MMRARVAGVGVYGPGLDGWKDSATILRGDAPYTACEVEMASPSFLNSRERRRTSLTVRLALNVAEEAVSQSGIAAEGLSSVFGTANGDGAVIHNLLESLVQPGKFVSPTLFHNSVHNAAVGYWAIGTSSHKSSTCVAAHDFTFAAALIKALTHIACENQPVLVVVYDAPFPEPLNSARPMAQHPFGLALVLTPADSNVGFSEIALVGLGRATNDATRPRDPNLLDLWSGNPAARGLPVLEALARGQASSLTVQYLLDGHLQLELTPC